MKISVIIPVYNVEKYLNKCVDSIIKYQVKTAELEVILVDDGSTDNSGAICDAYADRYDNISVIHQKNAGLSAARNTGIDVASGEYIYFIDSDDYLVNPLFENFVYAVDKYPKLDIYHFGYVFCYESNINVPLLDPRLICYSNVDAYKQYLLGTLCTRMAWDKVYKRELFEGVRYPVGKLVEDYGTTYKLIAKSDLLVKDERIFYGYFQRENSIMGKKSKKLILDEYEFGCENKKFAIKAYPKLRNLIFSTYINMLIKTYARLNKAGYNSNREEKNFLRNIRRECASLLLEQTRMRTKLIQCILVFCPPIGCAIINKKDKMQWTGEGKKAKGME